MENLKGCNTGDTNGTFLKNSAMEAGTLSVCCNAAVDIAAQDVWRTCGQQHMHNNNNTNLQDKCAVVESSDAATVSSMELGNSDASYAGIKRVDGSGDSCIRTAKNMSCECANDCGIGAEGTCGCSGGTGVVAEGDPEASCAAGAIAQANIRTNQKLNGDTYLLENAAAIIQDVYDSDVIATALATPSEINICTFDGLATAETASASAISPSASLNNSTENLSYCSDNYYPDDLILLEGHDDVDVNAEAEEISLNSDDCVYAYRGDGNDLELALDAIAGRGHGVGNAGIVDDETDFLEMDFEPDPLSEVEYGSVEPAPGLTDAFLIQRDSCHLSGRHSATLENYHNSAQRQLFSSPIDDGLPPQPKTLQSQLLLSKNYARIAMHLDQIKGENIECDVYEHAHSDRASVMGILKDAVDDVSNKSSAAHSLPNTLTSHFGRDVHTKEEIKTSPSKVTGAKPKRFSTLSTSSSTSSKNSSKSRNSLRSSYALATLCNSSSFDERSVSCSEFRCGAPVTAEDCLRVEGNNAAVASDCDDLSINDEVCLDCLEKEFLAKTIGKAIDLNDCLKCRKRSSSSIASYQRASQATTMRCSSGSPLFFHTERDDCIFENISDYLGSSKAVTIWTRPLMDKMLADEIPEQAANTSSDSVGVKSSGGSCLLANENDLRKSDTNTKARFRPRVRAKTCDVLQTVDDGVNQRSILGDSSDGEQLSKNLLLTEKESVTVPTLNLSEEMLVLSLDKLHVTYNLELIKSHFKLNCATANVSTHAPLSLRKHPKEFKDLKHFLLHESKRYCNHIKLKRLIELATRHRVDVSYHKDTKIVDMEMIPVNVADILNQWMRTKNLNILKELDRRFLQTNVLGKVANIIRQAQQRCTPRRPLPEHISIPQYYDSGFLTLTKKC